MSDIEDMDYFDRLPSWVKEVLHEHNRKFKAAEVLPLVEGGTITPFNIRPFLANIERQANQRERRGYR